VIVRTQLPVSLDDESEPEPDLALVPGSPGDYRDAHPAQPALVVEVADSSLTFDRHDKANLYARAGIGDYWILNLAHRVVGGYREPVADPDAVYGWRYRSVTTLEPAAIVAPLVFPDNHV